MRCCWPRERRRHIEARETLRAWEPGGAAGKGRESPPRQPDPPEPSLSTWEREEKPKEHNGLHLDSGSRRVKQSQESGFARHSLVETGLAFNFCSSLEIEELFVCFFSSC